MRQREYLLPSMASRLFLLAICLFVIGCTQSERDIVESSSELKVKWIFRSPERIRSVPYFIRDHVVIRTNSQMVGVDSKTGSQVWKVASGSPARILMVGNPQTGIMAYAADNNWVLNVINVQDGSLLWSTRPSPPVGLIFAIALNDESVYTGLNRDSPPVRAYTLSNGQALWSSDSTLQRGFATHFLFEENKKLFVFVGGDLFVIDKDNGKVQRTIESFLDGGDKVNLIEGHVYFQYNHRLRAKDVETGRLLWEANLSPDYYSVLGERVYVGSGCCVLSAFDTKNGIMIWQRSLDASPVSSPVAIENMGYMILANASIIAFDLETGQDRGKISTSPAAINPEGLSKGLATDGTFLYATFGDNTLFAFGP